MPLSDRHLLDLGSRRGRSRADHRRLGHRDGPAGQLPPRGPARGAPRPPTGCRPRRRLAAILAGSCSAATLEQIERIARSRPRRSCSTRSRSPTAATRSTARSPSRNEHLGRRPAPDPSSAPPEQVAKVQERLGRERAGAADRGGDGARSRRAWSPAACADWWWPAARPRARWWRRSACRGLRIGPPIDPGVPWTVSLGEPAAGARAEIGQFRRPRLLPQSVRVRAVTESRLREEIAAFGALLTRPRPRPRQHRQHQRPSRRRLADDADQLAPRPARPGAHREARSGRPARRGRSALQGGVPPSVRLRDAAGRPRDRPSALDPFGRRLVPRRDRRRRRAAAAHRLLRDAGRQAAADPVLPARATSGSPPRSGRSPAPMPRCCSPTTDRWSRAGASMPRSARSRSSRRRRGCICCSTGAPRGRSPRSRCRSCASSFRARRSPRHLSRGSGACGRPHGAPQNPGGAGRTDGRDRLVAAR